MSITPEASLGHTRRRHVRLASVITALLVAVLGLTLQGSAGAAPAATDHESIFAGQPPANAAQHADYNAVELGTKFTAESDGTVLGVKFYKSEGNGGTHVGNLWTIDGEQLATATFQNETAAGWQSVTFSEPVAIEAGQTYVASYLAPEGGYDAVAEYSGQSASEHLTIKPWSGVYSYGSASSFPNDSWKGSQYFVDVMFAPASAAEGSTPAAPAEPAAPTEPTAPAAPAAPVEAAPVEQVAPVEVAPVAPAPVEQVAPVAPAPVNDAATTGCAAAPSQCGYPDATNTGVQDGVALKNVPGDITSGPGWSYDARGWISVHTEGAVLENITTSATIDIQADNTTVRNVRSTASGETFGIAIRSAENTTITDSEIMPPTSQLRLLVGIKDIYGDASGTKVLRTEITNTSTGVQIPSGLIEGNYIHSMGMASGDHINGQTSNGGTTQLTIRHNTILNEYGQTDAVSLFQDFGVEANRLIENNLLAGGGYTIYAGAGSKGATSNIVVRDNRVSTMYFPNGGQYGPATAFEKQGSGNVWSGNIWDETGAVIPAP